MRIKRRKHGIGVRLTFRDVEKSATRRLGKNPNEGKVTMGNLIICGSTIFLIKFDFLPESFPCRELLTVVIAVAFMYLGCFFLSKAAFFKLINLLACINATVVRLFSKSSGNKVNNKLLCFL